MSEIQFEERRSGRERRARPTSPFTLQSLFGSRGHYRRKEDARKFLYVDVYSKSTVAFLIATMILSITDAFLTLWLVGKNVSEVNPVMEFFLNLGPFQFIMIKLFMTAFGLVTLLVLKNHYLWGGRIKIGAMLFIFPFLYVVLVSYEVLLVLRL
jgi:hypothetical protein